MPPFLINTAAFQAYNLVIVWAEAHVDRNVAGRMMPVTWILTLDGMMSIIGVLIALSVWRWLARQGREPDTMTKFATASVLVTFAYAILAWGAGLGGSSSSLVPLAILVLFFVVLDLNFGWVNPPGCAFVSRFAPARLGTTLMSVNLLAAAGFSNIAVGWLGRFYEPLGAVDFWWLNAGIAASGGAAAMALRPVIARLLYDQERTALVAVPA